MKRSMVTVAMVGLIVIGSLVGRAAAQQAQATSTQPQLIKDVKPAYPAAAIRAKVTGVVTMEVTVGVDGHVQDARVVSGDPLLQQAALDSVKQWLFTPAMLNGVPVPKRVTLEESFDIRGAKPSRSAESTPSA